MNEAANHDADSSFELFLSILGVVVERNCPDSGDADAELNAMLRAPAEPKADGNQFCEELLNWAQRWINLQRSQVSARLGLWLEGRDPEIPSDYVDNYRRLAWCLAANIGLTELLDTIEHLVSDRANLKSHLIGIEQAISKLELVSQFADGTLNERLTKRVYL